MRASVHNLIKYLNSCGLICIASDFKVDSTFGFGCAVLYDHLKSNTVSITVGLSGITVTVSTGNSKSKIVVNQKERLTEKDYAKIIFNLN